MFNGSKEKKMASVLSEEVNTVHHFSAMAFALEWESSIFVLNML